MAVKKEAGAKRSMELQFDLPGTPEQVWQAIATGPGISSWFVPSEVEERAGGAVAFHIGPGMESSGKITAWEPPRRFAYEEPGWNGDAPPLGTEFIIEARAGGMCKVRLVHSLFTSQEDWDDQLDSMETGWPPFFEVLRLYLTHFPGQHSASIRPTGHYAGTQAEAWDKLLHALDLTGASVGQRRKIEIGAGGPSLSGVVERIDVKARIRELMLRFEPTVTGSTAGIALFGMFTWAGRVQVAISLYFYGEGAERAVARERPLWEEWIAQNFPRIEDAAAAAG